MLIALGVVAWIVLAVFALRGAGALVGALIARIWKMREGTTLSS